MIPGSVEVEKQVLKRVVPSPDDERKLKQAIDSLYDSVKRRLLDYPDVEIEPVLVGSTAKDTYLRDSLDIDLFLVFSSDISEKELERIGLGIGRSLLSNQEECYAQHPYVRGLFEGYATEIVPCYQIGDASEKRSAVDRTPLHTKYIITHLENKQRNEVRLFKQFLKGIGCYGADAEVEGFSGYLCELLILKYGTFQNAIEAGKDWKPGVSLRLDDGEFPFFDTPLVFIDPVDPDRNVASALIREKFDVFIHACHDYIEKPGSTFFFPQPLTVLSLNTIREKLSNRLVISVEFNRPDIIVENLYPQLRKATRAVADTATSYGFKISDAVFYVTESSVGVVVFPQDMKLSSTMLHMGPPMHLKKNAEDFLEKWRDHERMIRQPFEKDGRWYVEIKREYTSLETLLDAVVPTLSLGKHMTQQTSQSYCIKKRDDLITDELREFWTTYLDDRMPWER